MYLQNMRRAACLLELQRLCQGNTEHIARRLHVKDFVEAGVFAVSQKGGVVLTAKEYLSQAQNIDQKIDSMLEQAAKLRSIATKTTAVISGMPGSATKNPHRLSDVVVKLVEQEEAIDREIDRLVALRAEIYCVIQNVDSMDERLVLELRYMSYRSMPEIARQLEVSERQVYRIHERGLQHISVPSTTG